MNEERAATQEELNTQQAIANRIFIAIGVETELDAVAGIVEALFTVIDKLDPETQLLALDFIQRAAKNLKQKQVS